MLLCVVDHLPMLLLSPFAPFLAITSAAPLPGCWLCPFIQCHVRVKYLFASLVIVLRLCPNVVLCFGFHIPLAMLPASVESYPMCSVEWCGM